MQHPNPWFTVILSIVPCPGNECKGDLTSLSEMLQLYLNINYFPSEREREGMLLRIGEKGLTTILPMPSLAI